MFKSPKSLTLPFFPLTKLIPFVEIFLYLFYKSPLSDLVLTCVLYFGFLSSDTRSFDLDIDCDICFHRKHTYFLFGFNWLCLKIPCSGIFIFSEDLRLCVQMTVSRVVPVLDAIKPLLCFWRLTPIIHPRFFWYKFSLFLCKIAFSSSI